MSCVARVTSTLKGCSGVQKVKVNFEDKTAQVRGEAGKMKSDELLESLKKTKQYTGTVIP